MKTVSLSKVSEYPLLARGKVRDIYEIDKDTLLLVSTDRVSAFDVIMNSPIPYKGVVLNQITLFWMKRFEHIIPNHLISADIREYPAGLAAHADELEGRSVLVKRAAPLPMECIVRGHISGSGWKDYKRTGTLCGIELPLGLRESDKLGKPLFTPSTKAQLGSHDENISEAEGRKMLGDSVYEGVKEAAVAIFSEARAYAATRGIIIADTKFEFGMLGDELLLIDEVLTPDSSRFWPLEGYAPGRAQPSLDKQYLRNWLLTQNSNMQAPPPILPDDVLRETARRYFDVYRQLTGQELVLPL